MSVEKASAFLSGALKQRRIADALNAFKAGDFSPAELATALEQRKQGMNSERLAKIYISQSTAPEHAAQGALGGIPISIKDLFDVKGEQTRAGSKVLSSAPAASEDAPSVARLREAGTWFTGRTNMTEFAFSGLGLNPHYGSPENPFDASLITGGSTSGGAASIADGLALGTLGSDTGGSLRIPAAFCGIVGFKPSQASVPGDAAFPLSPSLDCVGPMGASVDCCARLWSVLSQTEVSDADIGDRKLRLAIPAGALIDNLEAPVAAAFEQAVELLRQQGHQIETLAFDSVDQVYAINQAGGLVVPEAIAIHKERLEAQGEDYDPFVRDRLQGGLELPAWVYAQRLLPRGKLQQQFAAESSGFDAVILPTVPILPPAIATLEKDAAAFHAANRMALHNTNVFNYLDASAISLPWQPQQAKLPIGLMLARPQGQDLALLALARRIEALIETQTETSIG
ncbi:amidase [Marinobacterium lutimaris]|uniref:Aspartyl-tRNA(Asn)/glutamyl-tRNA(Gln) amidotransferase subunit A n=1 Tax=Marinobacterium lutimaris TaxID=568106 RepID=A0A1H6DG14_9GAMM|nr:amidase [Marinobacterium lutimaris]SEG84199.1 aspartyl-tRNA(Asn)/glutamyl-tRNA(Gln) amidotransferase subunit A [Marinobacterium lutimaris]